MPGILFQLIWAILRLLTSKRRLVLNQQLRNDNRGSGHFGAPRSHGTHNGIDIRVEPGEEVHAPLAMYVERESKANARTDTSGVRFIPRSLSDGTHGYIWYFKPYPWVIGQNVEEGTPIGVAQNIAGEYGGGMQNHVHIEQWAGDKAINIESTYV